MREILTPAQFRAWAKNKTIAPESRLAPVVRMPLIASVKEIAAGEARDPASGGVGGAAGASGEQKSRKLAFTISTPSVDRMGDTIAADGWKLEAYKKNPVVLWAHDSSQLPIGKASNVRVEDGVLKSDAEFAPAELNPMAEQVLGLYRGGFLSAVSVGFVPLKWAWVDTKERWGIDFLEQELLEFSAVPVPANSEALIEESLRDAAARGIKPGTEPCHLRRKLEIDRLRLGA